MTDRPQKSFTTDFAFGTKREKDVLKTLQKNIDKRFQKTNNFDIVDYLLDTPDKKCMIELKSRNCRKNSYNTTLMPLNKYKYLLDHPEYKGLFLFNFRDGLWGCNIREIQENKDFIIDYFVRHKRVDYEDKLKKYLFINVSCLKPYKYLFKTEKPPQTTFLIKPKNECNI